MGLDSKGTQRKDRSRDIPRGTSRSSRQLAVGATPCGIGGIRVTKSITSRKAIVVSIQAAQAREVWVTSINIHTERSYGIFFKSRFHKIFLKANQEGKKTYFFT